MSIGSSVSNAQPAALNILFANGFIGSVLWYVLMGLLLVGAIGLFWYVRNKQQ
jgi:LPXTG-motif cell wall-anchored protein